MDTIRTGFIIIAAAFSFCASAITFPPPPSAPIVRTYYLGQASSFSPDGRIPYGNTDSAVKREILDAGQRIIETVTRPGPSPSMRPKEIVTEMRRRYGTLVYEASDTGATFAGTVIFQDSSFKSWVYDLKLKTGGTIKGAGKLLPEGIRIEQQLSGDGRPMSVKEDLKAVSEREYKMRISEMRPPKGAE